MIEIPIDRDRIRRIFQEVKPYFKQKLGKYTHQRISGDWHFHGLGFVNGDMTYVFGINIGFFKLSDQKHYSHAGMNVLVRTNGKNRELRLRYRDFFRKNLQEWMLDDEMVYTSDRGGIGSEFPRYKALNEFETEEDIIDFIKECVDGIFAIYPKIAENPENLFDNVLRAAPPWHDTLVSLAKEQIEANK
ncbi:MAG: hypothetical protein L3J74_10515 [Bacteroidales bacterium]|nr:hypothetical protein [Bacteroidales bacterium]